MDGEIVKLVTKGGECFDAAFQRKQVPPDRDGVLYLFHLNDCRNNRGMRLVSLFRSGPAKLGIQDYESRIENVRLNTLRRAFDLGALRFEAAYDEHRYKELRLDTSDFNVQPPASPEHIKQYIKNKAYWLGFKYNKKPGVYFMQFDTPVDLEYLGSNVADVRRYAWLLGEQGLLKGTQFPGTGQPTNKLVGEYESASSLKDMRRPETEDEWDVFISHASEDKDAIARPLADALRAKGLRVWYDEFSLEVGDSLRQSIDRGLAKSRFGVVILSAHFFAKHWPQTELNGLATREVDGEKVILPVWHNITFEEVRRHSPTLADRIAVDAKQGLGNVITQLMKVVSHTSNKPSKETSRRGMSLKAIIQHRPLPVPGGPADDEELHELSVGIENDGNQDATDFRLDVEIPAGFVDGGGYIIEKRAARPGVRLFQVSHSDREIEHLYPGTTVPNLVTVNCVIWGKVKREHPELLEERITATVYSGSMPPSVTTKPLAELRITPR